MPFVVPFVGNPLPIFDIPYAGFQNNTVVEYRGPWQRKWHTLPENVWWLHIDRTHKRAMLVKRKAIDRWLDSFGDRANKMCWDGLLRITVHQGD